jgi:hypothetical protein
VSLEVAEVIVAAAGVYLACGMAFAVPFLWRWVGRLDPAARYGTIGFRAAVLPGVAALWPLFVARLLSGARGSAEE